MVSLAPSHSLLPSAASPGLPLLGCTSPSSPIPRTACLCGGFSLPSLQHWLRPQHTKLPAVMGQEPGTAAASSSPGTARLLGPFVVPLWTLPRHSFQWPPSAHTELPTSPGWSEYFAASFSCTFIQHSSCPNQRSGCLSLAHSTVGNRLSRHLMAHARKGSGLEVFKYPL